MSRESIVFLLGIILFISPYLGVPMQWKVWLYTGAGLILIWCGYSLRRTAYLRSLERANGERTADSFAEHKGGMVSDGE